MKSASNTQFTYNYKQILVDEIALDGLEGIGVDLLWKRMEKRIGSPITQKMMNKYFNFIAGCESISFYKLNETPPNIEIIDRFTIIDNSTGHLLDPPDFLDGPYEYHPVENEYGSCPSYNTRLLIPKNALHMKTYEEIISEFGKNLVLVASLEERWQALASHLPLTCLNQLTHTHYCLLELVGKGRENGQMTIGKTNLNKIVKEPKLLFYNRNALQKLGLLKTRYSTQVTGGRAMKSILLRLKRFHRPTLESLPKVGSIHNIVQYLLNRPGRAEQNEIMIKKGYMTPLQSKRLQKGINIFHFEERQVSADKIVEDSTKKPSMKKKFVILTSPSDESSGSDDENDETLTCKYKVGVNLMRQAYEMFLEAGLNGLTQVEIAEHLGVEFYTSRTICRILKNRKIVREFLEDKGRQRTARYIAIAATKEMDKEYAQEKNKLLEYTKTMNIGTNNAPNTTTNTTNAKEISNSDVEYEVPIKKIKIEVDEYAEKTENNNKEDAITEIKVLDGFENNTCSLLNAKKTPTLRQLKFANGILKVIHKLKYVIGFQTLSTLVSKEINEPPMDTKSLKLFVQKLMIGGQLKILKLQRPKNYIKFTFFICAPHINATDPIITNKYKEICARSQMCEKPKKKVTTEVTRPCTQFIYPRYMKIQKLHEFLIKIIYFTNRHDCSYPLGFGSLFYIIPEMTIEFALGNINNMDVSDVAQLKFNESLYGVKLRDAPDSLGRILLQSKSLQNSIRVGLKVLAVLGLVQLISTPSNIMSKDGGLVTYLFYVNRKSKIIDTTGKWPRDVDLSALEKTFDFQTKEDVTNYWQEVLTISLNTTIIMAKREKYRLIHPMRSEDTVTEYDNGERFGDGFGPCGFDSSIFMDISRLWRTFIYRNPNCPQSLIVKNKKKLLKTKKVNVPLAKIKETTKNKKKKVVKREKEKGMKREIIPRRYRKKPVDSLIKWTEMDDRIIIMCKVALTIMSPILQPGCLRIRNTVARDLLSIFDAKKTASYCHKRALTLESNRLMVHEKNCILNELRRRKNLIKDYEGILRMLRIRYQTNITKFVNESRLPMLELIWIISQVERTKSYLKRIPCIAMDLKDFNANYTITPTSANRTFNIYKASLNKPEFATLKEAILLTVMLSVKEDIRSATAKKIYSTFKIYPEGTLRTAIEHLRKSGAIAAREKVMNNHFNKVNFDDIVHSSYKISAFYRRKWMQRLDAEFGDNLENLLDTVIPQTGLKGSAELNCILCEMCTSDVIEIVSDTAPMVTGFAGSILQEEQMNVIDMENKFKLKSGLIGWKSKTDIDKFSKLYENTDYDYFLQILNKYSVVSNINEEEKEDTGDDIVRYLNDKRESGATFLELMEKVVPDRKALCDRLTELQEQDVIKRVGMFDNILVLKKFSQTYFLRIKQGLYFIPTPWLNLEGRIQKDVFFKWAGVIMNKIFESPGCSIAFLSNNIECITSRCVQDICTFLQQCECVILKSMHKNEIDLFSNDETIDELYEFNPYDAPENILIFSVKNCLTKFVFIRKYMLSIIDISD